MKQPKMYNKSGPNTTEIPSVDYGLDGILPVPVMGRIPTVKRPVKIPTHKGCQRGTPYMKMNGNVRKRKYG